MYATIHDALSSDQVRGASYAVIVQHMPRMWRVVGASSQRDKIDAIASRVREARVFELYNGRWLDITPIELMAK